jgi:hypothetical protein
MAILDNELIMSNAQAETSIAAHPSTNIVDFGRANAGYNRKVFVTINTACTTTTSGATVAFAVQCDSDVNFGSPTTLFSVSATAVATLVAGYKVLELTLPAEVERYVRVLYTIATDTLATGKFNAWVDDTQQTNMTII